jgi:hypothetical protein
MASALQVIERAMRRLRVLGLGKEPKAAESEEGLAILNQMLSEWGIDGIDIAHTTLGLSDEIDVPADHESAIVLNLAKRMGGLFGSQLSPDDDLLAQRGRMALVAYHFSIADLRDESPLAGHNLSTDDC